MVKSDSKGKTKRTSKRAQNEHTKPEASTTARRSTAGHQQSTPQPPRPRLLGRTPFPKGGALTAWRLVDAAGLPLGRLSTQVATMLMGKDKPSYTRFCDTGDHVIVINAKKIQLTGKKWAQKTYYHHTNYPGGIKSYTAQEVIDSKHPERIVKWSVYGMLPKGHMGRRWYKKLHVYAGSEHPHAAQKPNTVRADSFNKEER